MSGKTRYSEEIKGADGNYGWKAKFDLTRGFLGISQTQGGHIERVLLSPKQIIELKKFLEKK